MCVAGKNTGAMRIRPCLPGSIQSFPVESDEHFWVVARYVERNQLRPILVLRAEEWRWSSLWQRCHPTGEERSLLAAWPIDMPANWLERVNQTDDAQELEMLRRSVNEAAPLASRNGRRKSRNVWASSRPIVPRVARERWAEIKMPLAPESWCENRRNSQDRVDAFPVDGL